MSSNRSIEAVCFDLGMTLAYSSGEETATRVLQELGHAVGREQVGEAAYRAAKIFMRERPGFLAQAPEVFYEDYLAKILELLQVDADPRQVKERIFARERPRSRWHLYPEARPVLEELRTRGLHLCLISNWDTSGPRVLRELGLDAYFAVAVFSELEGVAKPDPEIFRRALDRVGVAPPRALYVGDNYHDDAVGAGRAGMPFVLVDRLPHVDAGERWSCPTVDSLWGVLGFLEGDTGGSAAASR